jgi:putative ribosome biogenesis GTPase RsgA
MDLKIRINNRLSGKVKTLTGATGVNKSELIRRLLWLAVQKYLEKGELLWQTKQ